MSRGKIGQGCFVGPGVILNQDLGEERFLSLKQTQIVKRNRFETSEKQRKAFLEALTKSKR